MSEHKKDEQALLISVEIQIVLRNPEILVKFKRGWRGVFSVALSEFSLAVTAAILTGYSRDK